MNDFPPWIVRNMLLGVVFLVITLFWMWVTGRL